MRFACTLERWPVARVARVIAVVAIVIAAGHVAESLAERRPAKVAVAENSRPTRIILLSAGSTVLPPDVLPDTAMPEPLPKLAALSEVSPAPAVAEAAPAPATCPIDLGLDAEVMAMIDVALIAPCHAGERVVLRHAGLAVTGQLDADGYLSILIPAFLPQAELEVKFANGDTVMGQAVIEEAASLRRFGVQWQGGAAFAVHGFENGADYGQPGHVSSDTPKGANGSSLALLGDATVELPLLAQVFTYPTSDMAVEVVVEAAVTPETCGHDLLAEVIAVEGGKVEVTDLTLAMPECSGVGDFLVLKNLSPDMKLAAN